MSILLIVVASLLGLGVWGYFSKGDVLYAMNKLSASDVAGYASQAGFTGDDLVTSVAIALAESGGDPQAQGDNHTSVGLWQIHFTVHPEFDRSRLTDPAYNASCAYALYTRRGGTFQDWSAFTQVDPSTGVPPYIAFLPTAQDALGS
jgi:hypothetical protein